MEHFTCQHLYMNVMTIVTKMKTISRTCLRSMMLTILFHQILQWTRKCPVQIRVREQKNILNIENNHLFLFFNECEADPSHRFPLLWTEHTWQHHFMSKNGDLMYKPISCTCLLRRHVSVLWVNSGSSSSTNLQKRARNSKRPTSSRTSILASRTLTSGSLR